MTTSIVRTRLIPGVAVLAVLAAVALLLREAGTPSENLTGVQTPSRPNILLIISDDVGMDASTNMYPGLIDNLVAIYGPDGFNHPEYPLIDGRPASTPVLDNFVKQGMRFNQAWVQPFCSTTRASLLSGLNAAKTGVLDYTGWMTQNQHSFVSDLKKQGGYNTAIIGKWHMAGLEQSGYPGLKPKEAGFDLFLGNMHGGVADYWDYDYHVQDASSPVGEYRTETPPMRSLPGIAPTTYAPVVKIADTLDWITAQERDNPDQPWFVWLAFNLAHITGNQLPNPMAVPNIDTLDDISRQEMEACGGTFGSAIVGECTDKALMRAMTNAMDTVLGKLLDVVDTLDPNTYVIFMGDNGTWMFGPNREFIDNMYITRRGRSKGTTFESGVLVPLVVRGPGITPDTQNPEFVHGLDLFATILDLAGLEIPVTVPNRDGDSMLALDSLSIKPLLLDGASTLRDPDSGYILAETVNPVMNNMRQVAARNGTYKLVCTESAATDDCLFYNLRTDPIEEYPLAKPGNCDNYQSGNWTVANPDWHFCRLQEVIGRESFLATL